MANFYLVTVSWAINPVHPPLVEGVISLSSDWVRLTHSSWLIYSDKTAKEIGERLHGALAGDSFLIAKADPTDMWGNSPQWLWTWIYQRMFGAQPGSLPPPSAPVPVPTLLGK